MTQNPTEEDFKQFKFLYEPTGRDEQLKQFISLDVGKGWSVLLYVLFGSIKRYLSTVRDDEFLKNFYVLQVKQKFGGLRIYISRSDKVILSLISEAEAASWEVCEECGKFGVPRPMVWIETLCHWHYVTTVWHTRYMYSFTEWVYVLWDAIINKNGGKQ